MPTVLQFRRGTAAQNDSFTGSAGELTIDTSNKTLRVHDGATAGGSQLVALNANGVVATNLLDLGNTTQSIVPSTNNTFDLGSPEMVWRDVYIGPGSLYVNGQKVVESDAGTIVVQADEDQSMTVKTTGTGVLTLQSQQTVNFAATMQMANGKKITSASGEAVMFGDKIDMDQNQIINVARPTSAQHVATKEYVDDAVGDVLNGAPAALDTLNELATALGDDANFATNITNTITEKAANAYSNAVATAAADATTKADAAVATAAADATTKASAAYSNAVTFATTAASDAYSNAVSYTDTALAAAINAAPAALDTLNELAAALGDDANFATNITNTITTKTDLAYSNAVAVAAADAGQKAETAYTNAVAYVDTAVGTTYSNAVSYADSAAAGAFSNAVSTAAADATTKADAAQSAAISAAGEDATTKADAAQAAAASDATSKANAAYSNAVSYTDSAVSDLIAAAPGALDTLNELAAALGDDANFASNITTTITNSADAAEAAAISAAASDATTKANAAQSAAISAAASDATSKANAAYANAVSYTDSNMIAIYDAAGTRVF